MGERESIMASRPKYTISLATEADLPTLVEIQFQVFSFFPPEVLSNGKDTPANRAKVVERHRTDMHSESGLRIAKVELVPDSISPSPSTKEEVPLTRTSNQVRKIIGFCMFCLPNNDADTPANRIPRSIRPRPLPLTAPSVTDPAIRAQVERFITATYTAVQPVVAGRPCAWIRYMSVLPGYQRLGIGHALMDWGCRLFDEQGVNVALLASEMGEGLYRKFGFKIASEVLFEVDDNENFPAHVIKTAVMWRDAVVKPRPENPGQE